MRFLNRVKTSSLAALASILTLTAFAVISPYLPGTRIHAQQVGPGGVPGAGGGGGSVSSVFGRTGAVVAATGDYTAAQVTNSAATNAANTFSLPQTYSAGAVFPPGQGSQYQNDAGASNWTVYSPAGNNSVLFFSSARYSNMGWIRDNTLSGYGFGLLNNGAAGYTWGPGGSTNSYSAGLFNPSGTSGLVEVLNGSNGLAGTLEAAAFAAGGTVFTVSGCGTPTATGGGSTASFTAGATSCNPVITFGTTAAHGWNCFANDETTNITFRQTAHTTTSCTLTASGSATTSDSIVITGASQF